MKRKFLFVSVFFVLFFSACQEADQKTVKTGDYQTSIQDLDEMIHLPYKPHKANWKTERMGGEKGKGRSLVPGPTDYTLVAFLEFDKKTVDKIKQEAGKPSISTEMGEIGVYRDQKEYRDWYPLEIKDPLGGEEIFPRLFFLQSSYYPPEVFSKNALIHGSFFLIDEKTICLRLHTM